MKNDEIQKLIEVNDSNKKALDFSRRGAVAVNKAMADTVHAAKTYLSIYDNGMIVPNPDVLQGAAYYVIKSLLKEKDDKKGPSVSDFHKRLLFAFELFCIAKHGTFNDYLPISVKDIYHIINRTKENLEAALEAEKTPFDKGMAAQHKMNIEDARLDPRDHPITGDDTYVHDVDMGAK